MNSSRALSEVLYELSANRILTLDKVISNLVTGCYQKALSEVLYELSANRILTLDKVISNLVTGCY
ncbi:MAG: hypothetical protein QM793_14035 [Muricomes sp.]